MAQLHADVPCPGRRDGSDGGNPGRERRTAGWRDCGARFILIRSGLRRFDDGRARRLRFYIFACPCGGRCPPAKTDSSAAPVGDASPKSEPSLLTQADGKAKPDADAKPADGKAADTPAPAADPKPDAKAEPAKEAAKDEKAKDAAPDPAKDAPAAAPPAFVLEDLKVPEGAKLAEKEGKAFADLINNAEIGAKDKAQGLLDLHLAEVKRVADTISQQQRDAWTTFNDAEKNRLRTDPELGGNRLNTTLAMAKAVVEEYLPAESASKLLAFMDYSGAGNQREMVELLHNIGRAMNVFEDKIVAANAKAPAMPKGSPGSGKTGWYPTMPNGAGGP